MMWMFMIWIRVSLENSNLLLDLWCGGGGGRCDCICGVVGLLGYVLVEVVEKNFE